MRRLWLFGITLGLVVASACTRFIESYHSHAAICDPNELAKLEASVIAVPGHMLWVGRGMPNTFQVCVQTDTVNGQDCMSLGDIRRRLAASQAGVE